MKFPIFSFPALKKKFSSHISSFCSKKRPAIKDFLHYAGVPLLFALSFLAGSAARVIVHHFSPPEAVATSSDCASWGLSFQEEGKRPVGNASIEELQQYDAYYAQDTDEKNIYLTFDCGYENGNTEIILDALKKHNAPATFFVVGNFLSTSPEIVKRMISDGHIVGNHSYHHPDMSQISSIDSFSKELQELSDLYKEATGQEMKKYYRPPQGKYSETNLKMAKDLGYKTFFWSLAYVDWYQDNQPSKEEAFDKLLNRIHPGAIVLLHSTSSTNAQILDELLGKWEEMGYQFRSLDYLVEQNEKNEA